VYCQEEGILLQQQWVDCSDVDLYHCLFEIQWSNQAQVEFHLLVEMFLQKDCVCANNPELFVSCFEQD
jgi:hypothetical protein